MRLTSGVDMSKPITVTGTLEVTFVNREVLDEFIKGEERKRENILHFIREVDITWLEMKFATLTPAGWVIPEWVSLLRKTMKKS